RRRPVGRRWLWLGGSRAGGRARTRRRARGSIARRPPRRAGLWSHGRRRPGSTSRRVARASPAPAFLVDPEPVVGHRRRAVEPSSLEALTVPAVGSVLLGAVVLVAHGSILPVLIAHRLMVDHRHAGRLPMVYSGSGRSPRVRRLSIVCREYSRRSAISAMPTSSAGAMLLLPVGPADHGLPVADDGRGQIGVALLEHEVEPGDEALEPVGRRDHLRGQPAGSGSEGPHVLR